MFFFNYYLRCNLFILQRNWEKKLDKCYYLEQLIMGLNLRMCKKELYCYYDYQIVIYVLINLNKNVFLKDYIIYNRKFV